MYATTDYYATVTREDHLAAALSDFSSTLEAKSDAQLMAMMGTADAELMIALRDSSPLGLYRLEVVEGKIEILGEVIAARLGE